MKAFYIFATLLVLMTACSKAKPEEELPPEVPSGGKVYFSLAVKVPPLVEQLSEDEDYMVIIPFDKDDQMVVTGDGVSGTLTYDPFLIRPGTTGFSGFLYYEGPGKPANDLKLEVRRINPAFANDGKGVTAPASAQTLEEAVYRYGCSTGTFSYGSPIVELSQETAFFSLYLNSHVAFPSGKGNKATLTNDGTPYGPFNFDITKSESLVLALPGGTKLSGTFLKLDGISTFPVKPWVFPDGQDSQVLEGGIHYSNQYDIYDLTRENAYVTTTNVVIYQSNPLKSTEHVISTFGDTRNVTLSNINISTSHSSPILFGSDTSLWVDGYCKAVSTYGENPAIAVVSPYSLHISGDGTLIAESGGEVGGGAGIQFGGPGRQCGDLVIEGSVSVEARGAEGASGIGMGMIPSYQMIEYYLGNIVINTSGTVKATGGAGAAGIGSARLPDWAVYVAFGKISVSGGVVDATAGSDDVPDIGVCEGVDIRSGVSVDAGVTHDGIHNYHVARTEGDVVAGYKKD